MKKLIFIFPVLFIIVFIIAVALIKRPAEDTTVLQNSKIKIVAVENSYGDIAGRIAGTNAEVFSILSNPAQDPHEYEATATDARKVSDADIIVENGAGYDSFINKLILNKDDKTIINVAALVGKTENDNPHLWYNLEAVREFSGSLKDILIEFDSSNRFYYESNYNNFINSMSEISRICDAIKSKGSIKAISIERVADYILNSCGVDLITNSLQKDIEEGNDSSIQSINEFQDELISQHADVLIYNYQTESQITEKLKRTAKSNNVPIVGMSETLPAGVSYSRWMTNQLTDFFIAINK